MNDREDRIFALFLRKYRKKRNLTLENIGKAIDKTPTQIGLIEKGVYSLSSEQQDHIANVLGFPKYIDNWNLQPYFDNLLARFDDLFFHQNQEEVDKLLEQIDTQKTKWESSSMFFMIDLFELIPCRYEKENEKSKKLIKELERYTEFMTSFELFFYYSLQGVIAYRSRKIGEARFFFEKALNYERHRIGLYIQLAMVYQTLEYRQKSLNCIYKANILMLQNPDVYRMLQLSLLYTNFLKEKSLSYQEAINQRLNLYETCMKMNEKSLAGIALSNISYMYICNEDYINGIVFSKKSLGLEDDPSSNCHWFIPYCYWKLKDQEESRKWINRYRTSTSYNYYVVDMCRAIEHFLDNQMPEGITVLERIHHDLLEAQEMESLLFLLDWLIELYSKINDLEKMYLCEKEARSIYQRRTEVE